MLTLRFDGLLREIPNGGKPGDKSGFLCYGWLIMREGVIIARGHGVFAHAVDATSNVAEYLALIEGLEALGDMGVRNEPVRILGDAKSVIEQMLGIASVQAPRMKPLHAKAQRLAATMTNLQWKWVPRKNNRQADQLTRHALRCLHNDKQGYQSAIEALHTRGGARRKRFLPLIDLRIFQSLPEMSLGTPSGR